MIKAFPQIVSTDKEGLCAVRVTMKSWYRGKCLRGYIDVNGVTVFKVSKNTEKRVGNMD